MVAERSRAILQEFPASLITSTTDPIIAALRDFRTLVQATDELLSAQLPQARFLTTRGRRGQDPLEGISMTAARLLLDAGAVPSIDAGIVQFHQAVGRDKPGLRKIFNKVDRRAGRLPPLRGQAELVSKGLVRRSKKGPLQKLSRGDKRRIAKTKGVSLRTKEIVLGKPLTASSRAKAIAKKGRR